MMRPLLAALLVTAPVAAQPARPQPLRPAEATARATQLAQIFAAICRGPDPAASALAAAAQAQGFRERPARRRTSGAANDWQGLHSEWALHPAGDEQQPPLLFLWLDEERRPDGRLFKFQCELKLPASAAAPPRREVDAVFKAVNAVLAGPGWALKAAKTPFGTVHVAERDAGGVRETYAAAIGLHTLTRATTPASAAVSQPD